MENIIKRVKGKISYLIIPAMGFYIVPFFLDGENFNQSLLLLLFIIPLLCFITGTIYGVQNGRSFLLPILVGIIYIPSMFIFYDELAVIYYLFAYMFVTLVGNLSGSFIGKNMRKN